MGQHFSKRRRKKSRTNSAVSPSTITLKEKIIDELNVMQEQLNELKNIKSEHRPPTPSPIVLKISSE
jgi:hypothetical protein